MGKPLDEECPVCKADLIGARIVGSDPPEYYSKIIGVEIRGLYDGVLFWECPNCEARFHRFKQGTREWKLAEPHVRNLAELEIKKALAPYQNTGKVQLEDGTILYNVHSSEQCVGNHCSIHNPSIHPLSMSPRSYADGLILRVCGHGAYHPDFDALAWAIDRHGSFVYGHPCCSGECCGIPKYVDIKATDD